MFEVLGISTIKLLAFSLGIFFSIFSISKYFLETSKKRGNCNLSLIEIDSNLKFVLKIIDLIELYIGV